MAKEWQDELGLNVTAMDFRQYDNAIGRFYGMDRLSELGYSITPYRFAYNNPVYWGDPTGLLENNGENFARCPDCPNTPKFKPFIDSEIDFEYDKELDEAVLTFEGVEVSTSRRAYLWGDSDKSLNFSVYGQNRLGDSSGNRKGSSSYSIDASEMLGMSVNRARNINSIGGFLRMIKSFFIGANDVAELSLKADKIKTIIENSNTSTMEVNNIEPVMPPDEAILRDQTQIEQNTDTVRYNLNAWKDGMPQGGGEAYGKSKAKSEATRLVREWKLDSVSITPANKK